MAIQTFPLVLKWSKMLTANVKHLAFTSPQPGHSFIFIPGQFISVHFPLGEEIIRRSYSIASIPGQNEEIEFALSYFKGGAASEFLFGLEPGAVIEASGPYGRLVLRDEQPNRYILVATGTGVTPYRSMLPELAVRMAANPALQVILLLGVQTRSDLLYAEDFRRFAAQHTRFTFHTYYSREKNTPLLADERLGYVQTAFPSLTLDPDGDIIYLCGNPHMIDDAVIALKDLGFVITQIRREKYVS